MVTNLDIRRWHFRILSKFFFLASAKISSAVTSTNALAQGPPGDHQRCMYGETTEITEPYLLLFLVPRLLNSRGRKEVRSKMPGLDGNTIYSMRCSYARKSLFQSISIIPCKRYLKIFRPRNLIIRRQGHFVWVKCTECFFLNLRKRNPMPTSA